MEFSLEISNIVCFELVDRCVLKKRMFDKEGNDRICCEHQDLGLDSETNTVIIELDDSDCELDDDEWLLANHFRRSGAEVLFTNLLDTYCTLSITLSAFKNPVRFNNRS